MLKIENLSCSPSGIPVLRDLKLQARENEILGITGGSGCGKSLIASILAGNFTGYTGSITLGDRELARVKKSVLRKTVSFYSPLNNDFNPDSTLYDSIIRGRRLHKNIFAPYSAGDRELTGRYMEQLELEEYSPEKIKNIPRAAACAAMIAYTAGMECEVMVLDSPDAFLDYRRQILVSRLLKKYSSSGERSVIIATGNIDFLVKTCDRLVVIHNGIVAESGSHEMVDQEFMKRYFNVNSMVTRNIVTGLPEIHIVENA